MKNSLREVASAAVTMEDLSRTIEATKDLHTEGAKGFEARTFAMTRVFGRTRDRNSNPEETRQAVYKMMAVNTRIEQMLALRDDPRFEAWCLDMGNDDDEPIVYREDLLTAAAATPLRENDGDLQFDPEEFFETLLRVSEEDGKA